MGAGAGAVVAKPSVTSSPQLFVWKTSAVVTLALVLLGLAATTYLKLKLYHWNIVRIPVIVTVVALIMFLGSVGYGCSQLRAASHAGVTPPPDRTATQRLGATTGSLVGVAASPTVVVPPVFEPPGTTASSALSPAPSVLEATRGDIAAITGATAPAATTSLAASVVAPATATVLATAAPSSREPTPQAIATPPPAPAKAPSPPAISLSIDLAGSGTLGGSGFLPVSHDILPPDL